MNTHKVRVGNSNLVAAVSIGDIDVKVKHSDSTFNIHTICEERYLPEIKKELLSIGCTSEKGIRIIFEESRKRVVFYKNNKFIVDGHRENERLYKLNFLPFCKYSEANVSTSSSLMDWHEKLGHVNFQTLR